MESTQEFVRKFHEQKKKNEQNKARKGSRNRIFMKVLLDPIYFIATALIAHLLGPPFSQIALHRH